MRKSRHRKLGRFSNLIDTNLVFCDISMTSRLGQFVISTFFNVLLDARSRFKFGKLIM